jgi:hypothetical protein
MKKFHTMLNERVKLSYTPKKDEYQVEIIPTSSSLDGKGPIITIPSHILDELYNQAWEGKKPNRDGYYWCEKHSHEQTEPCPECLNEMMKIEL